jgi:hypothetical protein
VAVSGKLVRSPDIEIASPEELVDFLGRQLTALPVDDRLHPLREIDLQAPRQLEGVAAGQEICHAAFARLRVDADDGLIGAADVVWIDREIRHFPRRTSLGFGMRVHPLADRILMGTREGGVDEIADPWMSRVDRQLIAFLDDPPGLVEMRQVKPGVDSLRQQVERECHEVDVSGPLVIAEQRPLDPFGAGHQTELRCRDGRAPIVVGMYREHDRVPRREPTPEPLDPVRIHVGRKCSTVVGRLTIIFSSDVGPHSDPTASQISRAKSSSVW